MDIGWLFAERGANGAQENVSGDGLGEEVTEDMLPKYEASSKRFS